MTCKRCGTVPHISTRHGEALFNCAVEPLQDKLLAILHEEGYLPRAEGDVVRVTADSFQQLVASLARRNDLAEVEAEGISLLFLEQGQQLDFAAFSRTKNLKKWLFLLNNREFLDIFENNSLTTWFQPILSLPNHEIVAYECLSRGVKADGSLMPPHLLFKLAEENDLLFYLDRLCRENALKTAAVKKISADIFINFVPTSIYVPETCLQSTLHWAQQLEYDPTRVVFEVVETHQVSDLQHLRGILDYYRRQGFRTALDDIGSGHANLATLAALGADVIKVDMEIIRGIDADPVKQSIFGALVGIARENGIKVLAEGVETGDELAYVAQHGADLAQGYLFARPAPEPVRRVVEISG
ncbi:EAL domain-containing protein [Trichlorobacter ammonificans]|uniref:Diguanylate phosphodiesterase n=1 Tax=Trichlorobacter ammonificans TaxID=2916410 RepID=A0ABN8HJY3_9BACT|nr:EAL domain-containing protein [Trichlorobacter ammonificans]CAH2031556.1 Diguanylate phosphodiesterase [Trichlorobacter ammonificans]